MIHQKKNSQVAGMEFNHFDDRGNAVMVDVSAKQASMRTATAAAEVRMSDDLLTAIRTSDRSKG
jgi:cyclic pyranopterin monophosphate synthase